MIEEYAVFSVLSGILLGISGFFLILKKQNDELNNKRQKVKVRAKSRF